MLSRLYTFTSGQLILASQVNAELNQIVQLLSGVKLDYTILKFNGTSNPTLAVDNTAGGKILSCRVNGTERVLVNATGQLESTLATGTAPFKVASTTKVTNLNADQLDGLDSTAFMQKASAEVTGATAKLSYNATTGTDTEESNDGTTHRLKVTGGSDIFTVTLSSRQVTFPIVPKSSQAPSANDDLVRKDYVDTAITGGAGALLIQGQSGGTSTKVLRLSSANTWVDASQADTAAQLEGLCLKVGTNYYAPGSLVTGLSGLTAGNNYWLSTAGGITATPPTPSSTVRQVYIGKAISTTSLLFVPDRPIGG